MRRRQERQRGKETIDLIEEAVHLLRLAPARVLASYYAGSLPFVAGLLYFWADMSRSALAWGRCAEAALGLSVLYLWMKCWQTEFASQLTARIANRPMPRRPARELARLLAAQTVLQPAGLFAIPLAFLLMLPFGWVYAYYHNVSVVGNGRAEDVRTVHRRAIQLAMLWPGQNHALILVLSAFGVFVFVNVVMALLIVPELLRMLLGIQTTFTLSGVYAVVNTTFLATASGVTYLCMNPLIIAVYTVRCFYGESVQTGADLRVELADSALRQRAAIAALCLALNLSVFAPVAAATPDSKPGTRDSAVSASDLDRSITEVLQHREYAWRMPRGKPPPEEQGVIGAFIDGLIGWMRNLARTIGRWMDMLRDWLRDLWPQSNRPDRVDRPARDWMTAVQRLLFVLLAVAVCALAILFLRVYQQRNRRRLEVLGEPIAPVPDVADENVVADQLPEDGWLSLARDLLEKGDLRLALRALYLASLAHLARRELISIAKFKSNRDYERELGRRAHVQPEVLAAFAHNVTLLERVWYGLHLGTRDMVEVFTDNFERIRASAQSR